MQSEDRRVALPETGDALLLPQRWRRLAETREAVLGHKHTFLRRCRRGWTRTKELEVDRENPIFDLQLRPSNCLAVPGEKIVFRRHSHALSL